MFSRTAIQKLIKEECTLYHTSVKIMATTKTGKYKIQDGKYVIEEAKNRCAFGHTCKWFEAKEQCAYFNEQLISQTIAYKEKYDL